eukprot:3579022-Alexandrium_andersonii.AAC.1
MARGGAAGSKTRTSTASTKPTWCAEAEPIRLGAEGLLSTERPPAEGCKFMARRPRRAARRLAAADFGKAGSGGVECRSGGSREEEEE